MRKPIPGLDASFVPDANGVFYWAINKDYDVTKLVRNGSHRESSKGKSRRSEIQQAKEDSMGEDLAARGIQLELD